MGTWVPSPESNLRETDFQQADDEQASDASTVNTTMQTMATMNGQSQAQFDQAKTLINNLLLSKVQTLRTMHMILGSIGMALALVMIFRIIREARKSSALQVSLRPRRFEFIKSVHTAEVFPLALAFAIVVQQLIFVTVQGTALNSVLVTGCSQAAQIVFPAIFLLGFTTLSFGVETTVRSFSSPRFKPKGKWANSICALCVAILLLFTWIPTAVWRSPNRCFGNLIWYPINYHVFAIGIISVLLFMLVGMSLIIMLQLMKSVKVDDNERVAASLVCYYIILTTLTYALVLPFFIQAYLRNFDSDTSSSRVAEIALFSNSITFVMFHLFVRVNANRMALKPLGVSMQQKRRRIRFFGPSDLAMTISGPILSSPPDENDNNYMSEKQLSRSNDFYSSPEKSFYSELGSSSPNRLEPSTWPLPPTPIFARAKSVTRTDKRTKSSYSLFPTRAEDVPRLPPTVYSPPVSKSQARHSKALKRSTTASEAQSITDVSEAYNDALRPPLPLFAHRHRRDSSGGSSATVQIGLRFSVAPAAIAAANATAQSRPSQTRRPALPAHPAALRRDRSDSSGDSIGLPIQKPSEPPSPAATPGENDHNSQEPIQSQIFKDGVSIITPENSSEYLQKARDKVLPPIPHSSIIISGDPGISGLRMNPVSSSTPIDLSSSAVKSPTESLKPAPGWI